MASTDAIPSVTKQGYSVRLLKSKIGGYNAGMAKVNGELWLCARVIVYVGDPTLKQLKFKLAWLKPTEGEEHNLEHLGNITIPDFDPDGHAEDPRIFTGPDGSMYVAFCHASDDAYRAPCQRVAIFAKDDPFTAHLLPLTKFEGNGDGEDPEVRARLKKGDTDLVKHPQKNWNYFFHGEKLFMIYWTYPHRVLELDPVTMQVVHEHNAEDNKRFAWQYGPLSGGTPPVPWKGKMLAFYHGFMPHPVRRRRYYMGAYTFRAEAPFDILEITPPLLRGSMNDPTNFEPPNHAGLPLVVFPCGLLMEEKDPDQCTVSMGINDSYAALGSFDLRLLPFMDIQDMALPRTFYFFTQDTTVPPRATQTTNLSWRTTKHGAGGVLATQNPMAIDDCLTRGGVAEIPQAMYEALVDEGEMVTPPKMTTPQGSLMLQMPSRIFNDVSRLPGWATAEKNMEFAAIILALRPDVAVEIGVYGGRSTISIALAMQAVGHGIVHGIDPWSPQDSIVGEVKANIEWWGQLDHESIYRTCTAAIDRFGVSDFVKIQRKRSDDAEVPDNIGLLIVDGNHTVQAIADVKRYVPKVAVGGFVYMDDLSWSGGNVSKAADLIQTDFGCKMLYKREEGAMFQKVYQPQTHPV